MTVKEKNLVPELRFPEFSGDWVEKRLGELYPEVNNGFVGTATPFYVDFGIPYLQGKNIKNGKIINEGLIYISKNFHNKQLKSQLLPNYVLMVQSGHVGECAVVGEQYKGANCHALLVMKPIEDVSSKFFVYLFYSDFGKRLTYSITTGNTIKHILASDVKLLNVKSTTLTEQKKIADFLTSVDYKLNQLKKKKELMDTYKKGLLQKLFPKASETVPELRFSEFSGEWEEKRLGDVSELITKGTTPTSVGFSFVDEGVTFVKVESILEDGKIDSSQCQKITLECHEALKRSQIKENDILFSIAGTLGRTGITNKAILPANTNQALSIIRLKNNSNIQFVNFSLNLRTIKKWIFQTLSVGAQPNLSLEQIKSINLKFPSLPEQKKIADLLRSVDDKIQNLEKQIDQTEQYKKGLLQRMFV